MAHPGVGALTAVAFVLIIGEANRFGCGKQIASYLGLVPAEDSSGERRRLGHISKQGNSLLRFLLVEAAQATARSDGRWRKQFFHLAQRRGRKIAKVAMARRLVQAVITLGNTLEPLEMKWRQLLHTTQQPGNTSVSLPSTISQARSLVFLAYLLL